MLMLFGVEEAVADIYITGVDDGTSTTLRFSGSVDTSLFTAASPSARRGILTTGFGQDVMLFGPVATPGTHNFEQWGNRFGVQDPLQDTGFWSSGGTAPLLTSFNGDVFGIYGSSILLPIGYSSGDTISGSITTAADLKFVDLDTTSSLDIVGSESKIYFNVPAPSTGGAGDLATAVMSAAMTGSILPGTQASSQTTVNNTALNALHNQRIVRARSRMGNPRVQHDTLARSDRSFGQYLNFARNQNLTLKQALGLEDIPVSHKESDKQDGKVVSTLEKVFSIEEEIGAKFTYEEPKRWEVYAVGDFGAFDQDALDTVNRGFQSRTWASSVGVEYLVNDNLNVGAAFTYADNNTDLDEGLGNVDIEGQLYSIYATAFCDNNRYLDVLYSYGDFDNTLVRNTLTAGGLATGTPDSDSHTFSINAGQNFEVKGLVTGPTLGFDYTEGRTDAYNETGGGAAALNYQARDYTSSISSLGWHASKTKEVNSGILTVQAFTSWEHEFTPEGGNVRASLANFPAALNLNQTGAAPGTDWMVLGAGAHLATRCGINFDVDYQTQLFREDVQAHFVGLKVSSQF